MTELGIKINKEFDIVNCFNIYLKDVFEDIKNTRDFKNKIHLHKDFIFWGFLKSLCNSHLELCNIEVIDIKTCMSQEINNDLDQPQRAISNYLIRESQETKFTQKEFYQIVIDSAQHELNLM